ncbi:hypothetical protein SUGI_1006620 [Cryptomeria japonica]|nr:hypothetical protein SUGI_1006620 [Cryptomeria japonica]
MGRKSEKKNSLTIEGGGKKANAQEAELQQMRPIGWIFKYADKLHPKFNRGWHCMVGDACAGLPFSTLLSAFHERYGGPGRITPNSPPQLQLHQGGADFPDNNQYQDYYLHLDHDVTGEILRRLTLSSLMRAKSVCKAWNMVISAPTFNLNVEDTDHFVMQQMVQGFQGIAFFSSALNRWFRIPLLPWKTWSWHYNKRYNRRPTQFYLCGAAAGLYLFLDWHNVFYRNRPVIINPVTKQRRDLPPLPLRYRLTPGAAVEFIAQSSHNGGYFQVITLGFKESRPWDFCNLLYNSTTNKWTDVPATPAIPKTSFFETLRWTSAVHNGVVYFTNKYDHLACYDIASGVFQFKRIEGGLPPKMNSYDDVKNMHTSLPSVMVCTGKLILVGRCSSWSLISVTPQDLLEDTVKSSDGTDFMVAAGSGKIWLTIKGSLNMMCLDLRSMEWSVLPGCPAEDPVNCFPRRAVCGMLSVHDKLSLFR